uniref:Mycothiol maleylpyruvate isomerase N-terminal domain n=1 Tax=Desulfovibrio sp. U5L TaxID=596152 RepID=I2PXW5_9BACT
MTTAAGNQLAKDIRQNIADLTAVCQGIDEETASRAPVGRWSPKEILSHLLGQEGGHDMVVKAYLEEDTPTLDLKAEQTYFSEKRAAMPVAELCAAVAAAYERMATLATTLTEEQLARKARIPMLKESPLGEYPTLESLLGGLGRYHLQSHTEHLREILSELHASKAT